MESPSSQSRSRISEDSGNNDTGNKSTNAPPAASTKRLPRSNTAHAESKLSERRRRPLLSLQHDACIVIPSWPQPEGYVVAGASVSRQENPPTSAPPTPAQPRVVELMESDLNESITEERTDANSPITSTRRLRKRDNNRINVIKSTGEGGKNPLRILARDRDDKEGEAL